VEHIGSNLKFGIGHDWKIVDVFFIEVKHPNLGLERDCESLDCNAATERLTAGRLQDGLSAQQPCFFWQSARFLRRIFQQNKTTIIWARGKR